MPTIKAYAPSLVLIRHAQSEWNLENRFSGWADPPLTEEGKIEAKIAAEQLQQKGFTFDLAFCSYLQRTEQTLTIMLSVLRLTEIKIQRDWRLNERHYGSLQGKIKTAAANNTTDEQIWRWRRSYFDKAEPLDLADPRHPIHDPRYKDMDPALLPAAENLAETRVRVAQFWREEVLPERRVGHSILISAHGNSLRALLMELMQMSVAEVEAFEIPTGTPIIIEAASEGLWSWRYLTG